MGVYLIPELLNKTICRMFYKAMVQYEVRQILGYTHANWEDCKDGYLMCMEHLFGVPEDDEAYDIAEAGGYMWRQIVEDIIDNHLLDYLQEWESQKDKREFERLSELVDEVDRVVNQFIDAEPERVMKSMKCL
jgi:hypothetical protein